MIISNYFKQAMESKGIDVTDELISKMGFVYGTKFKSGFRYDNSTNTTIDVSKRMTPKVQKQADIVVNLFEQEIKGGN